MQIVGTLSREVDGIVKGTMLGDRADPAHNHTGVGDAIEVEVNPQHRTGRERVRIPSDPVAGSANAYVAAAGTLVITAAQNSCQRARSFTLTIQEAWITSNLTDPGHRRIGGRTPVDPVLARWTVVALLVLAGIVDTVAIAVAQTGRNHLAVTGSRSNDLACAIRIATRLAARGIRYMYAGVLDKVAPIDGTKITVVTFCVRRAAGGARCQGSETRVAVQIAELALVALVVRVTAARNPLDASVAQQIAYVALIRALVVRFTATQE